MTVVEPHSEEMGNGKGSAQLELRHMRYFLAVASHLSFRRAAAHLGLAQPALSQQIAVLERILGVRVFDRTSRSVKLSQAGELFRLEAEQVLRQAERAQLIAERAGRGEVGCLHISYAGSTLYCGLLPRAVREFHHRFPQVDIEVEELGIEEQIEYLSRGAVDVGILRLPVPECPSSISILTVMSENYVVATPQEHALAGCAQVDVADLINQPIISSQTDKVGILRQVLEAMGQLGFAPHIVRARHFGAIVGLVGAGMGVAPLPASAQAIQLEGTVYRPLSGIGPSSVGIAYRSGELSPAVLQFVEIARTRATTQNTHEPTSSRSRTKASRHKQGTT